MNNELYLKTMFCCMACDGDIAEEELALVKQQTQNQPLFERLDIAGLLQSYLDGMRKTGKSFLSSFLKELTSAEMSESEELQLVKLAIDMIEADNNIEYSEVSFFKKIRRKLRVSDEAILAELPDKEDYLLPDIIDDEDFDMSISFDNLSFDKFSFSPTSDKPTFDKNE